MTVIAWDGRTLAADRMTVNGDTVNSVTKIRRLPSGVVVAICGYIDTFEPLLNWLEHGAPWPEGQRGERWSTLVVADEAGARFYEREPHPIRLEDPFAAWGVGREAAVGAMAAGADAVQAVEIAGRFVLGCGRGVDSFTVGNLQ